MNQILKELIILPSDADMLTYIRENEPCDIQSIENSTSLSRAHIEESVNKLKNLGYLEVENSILKPL